MTVRFPLPVNDEDYRFEMFTEGSMVRARVTHLPTGQVGESDEDTSQYRARGQAMERLNAILRERKKQVYRDAYALGRARKAGRA